MEHLQNMSPKDLLDFCEKLIEKVCELKSISQSQMGSDIRNKSFITRLKTNDSGRFHEYRLEYIPKILDQYHLELDENLQPVESGSFNKHHLRSLAKKLAYNLINVSTGIEHKSNAHFKILDVKEPPSQEEVARQRFIAIVGAGASSAATKGLMPTTKEGIEMIKKELGISSKSILHEKLQEELDRLHQIFRLEKDEFETQLLAISKFTQRKHVVEALRKICGFKYVPSISYEILAHMLKHRFLDAIINFNYDEVLDQAIEEEIYNGDYKFIYSDGDCPDKYNELLIDNRLKQPVYIKPHGTISHESTLRFTHEDYFSIPNKLRETMKKLLDSHLAYKEKELKKLRLNLIVIGYCIKHFEFISLVKNYLTSNTDSEITIWNFDINNNFKEFRRAFSEDLKTKINFKFINICREKKGKPKASLDENLFDLWNKIIKNFSKRYKPRGIERHLLINKIFNPEIDWLRELSRDDGNNARLRRYFKDRFFVELVISFLQSDGILNTRQILEDRAGKYFNLYKKRAAKEGISVSLRKFCKDFGFKIYKEFVWDTFVLKKPQLFYQIDKDDQSNLYHVMHKSLLNSQLEPRHNQVLNSEEECILKLLRGIRRRNIAKITPNYSMPHNHLFSQVDPSQILNTTLGWTFKFQEEIEKADEWDLLLSISEKGRFLKSCKDLDFMKNKKVELVLSSFDYPEEVLPNISPNVEELLEHFPTLSKLYNFLPWWLHNKHMVLLLKRKKNVSRIKKERKKWDLVSGFYYESRMLSRRVNPVFVKNEDDLEVMLYTFTNYWYRAREYTKTLVVPEREKVVPIIQRKDEIDQYTEELLGLWKD